jgi:hypothetical protein
MLREGTGEPGQAALARGMDLLYSYFRVSIIVIRMWQFSSISSQVETVNRVHSWSDWLFQNETYHLPFGGFSEMIKAAINHLTIASYLLVNRHKR